MADYYEAQDPDDEDIAPGPDPTDGNPNGSSAQGTQENAWNAEQNVSGSDPTDGDPNGFLAQGTQENAWNAEQNVSGPDPTDDKNTYNGGSPSDVVNPLDLQDFTDVDDGGVILKSDASAETGDLLKSDESSKSGEPSKSDELSKSDEPSKFQSEGDSWTENPSSSKGPVEGSTWCPGGYPSKEQTDLSRSAARKNQQATNSRKADDEGGMFW